MSRNWLQAGNVRYWMSKLRTPAAKKVSGQKFASPVTLPGNKMTQKRDELVSTGHSVSNIRFSRPAVPYDESVWEQKYRQQYEQLQLWNHRFWLDNNARFSEERKQFKQTLDSTADNGQPVKNQELYQSFYRDFLNSNYQNQIQYNKEWYWRNASLLLPAVKAILARLVINTRKKVSNLNK